MTVSGCRHPIQLKAPVESLNEVSGELTRSDMTAQVPCGNRRATECPDCARTYRKRNHLVIASGFPTTGDAAHVFFLTLTSPSFGPVHGPGWKKGKKKPARPHRCPCGKVHNPEQRNHKAVIGSPLDRTRYQYAEAVDWNSNASRIWARFMQNLRRTIKGAAPGLDVQVCRVAEPQRRGQVHFHAILVFRRGESSALPGRDNLRDLIAVNLPTPAADVVRLRAAGTPEHISAGSTIAPTRAPEPDEPANYWNSARSFGNRWDLVPLTPRPGKHGEPAHFGGMAAYMSKYLTKASAGEAIGDRIPDNSPITDHLERLGLRAAAVAKRKHAARRRAFLAGDLHRRAFLNALRRGDITFEQTRTVEFEPPQVTYVPEDPRPGDLKRAREGFGYAGPPRSSTHGYGITMKSLKEAAQAWTRERLGLPADSASDLDWEYDAEGTKRLRALLLAARLTKPPPAAVAA